MKKSKIFIITMLMLLVAMCIAPITVFATTEIGKVEINAVKLFQLSFGILMMIKITL